MVGRLLYVDESATRTSFLIGPENPLVDNGFFTEAGLLENIAQTVAAGAGWNAAAQGRTVTPGYIVSVKDFTVAALPRIGDELLTEITVTDRIADIIVISGKVICRDTVIAACEMKILTSI